MKEIIIDYSLRETMLDDEFELHIKKQFVYFYKGKLKLKEILQLLNRELKENGFEETTISCVKHHSAKIK